MADSETRFDNRGRPQLSIDACMAGLSEYVQLQTDLATADVPDDIAVSFNIGLQAELRTNADLRGFFKSAFAEFVTLRPKDVGCRFPNILKRLEIVADPGFTGYDDPADWSPLFNRLLRNQSYSQQVKVDLLWPVMSNVSERGKVARLVAGFYEIEDPVMIDLGCSGNANLKRLASLDQPGMHFQTTPVISRIDGSEERIDANSSAGLNYLLQEQPFHLNANRKSWGVDIRNILRDQEVIDQIMYDSTRWRLLRDKKKFALLKGLVEMRHPSVDFMMEDATTFDPSDLNFKADIVNLSYLLWQLKQADAERTIRLAEKWAGPNGLIVVQDTGQFVHDGQVPDFFEKPRLRWSGGVWVKNMAEPHKNFQHLMSYDEGRVNNIRIEPAAAELPGARSNGISAAQG